jgi:hypothetical protein
MVAVNNFTPPKIAPISKLPVTNQATTKLSNEPITRQLIALAQCLRFKINLLIQSGLGL